MDKLQDQNFEVGDSKEIIKQKIAIELESARLFGSFIIPLGALFLGLLFTKEYFENHSTARYLFCLLVIACIFFIISLRNTHLYRAKNTLTNYKFYMDSFEIIWFIIAAFLLVILPATTYIQLRNRTKKEFKQKDNP